MARRTVILHYHLFKNAGTSLDKILQENFPGRWVTREFDPPHHTHSGRIAEWIDSEPDAVAFSTHTGFGPVPEIEGVRIFSFLFLRDPVARIASAYRFERRQDSAGFGATLAKATDLGGYVRCRLAISGDRQCRNFQTHRLASFGIEGESEYERALAGLGALSFVGSVEDFERSLDELGSLIRQDFPEFAVRPVHLNRSRRAGQVGPRINAETRQLLTEANHDDVRLLARVAPDLPQAEEAAKSPAEPRSVIALIGPPRSGTTLIANAMLSHPRTTGVIEPFHSRRKQDYAETDPLTLADDFGLEVATAPHLVIKETTTRRRNTELTLALLGSARAQGLYTGLVIVLRCPFSAYLSQVEASRDFWREKRLTEVNEQTFRRFVREFREGLLALCLAARAQHFRLVSYEAFCAAPADELARLMALIPLRLDRGRQLSFEPPKGVGAGDPKTRQKAGSITPTPREAEADDLAERFGALPEGRLCIALRELVRNAVCHEPDDLVLDRLTALFLAYPKGI